LFGGLSLNQILFSKNLQITENQHDYLYAFTFSITQTTENRLPITL